MTVASAEQAEGMLNDLTHLLQDVVEDGASIGFLPPLAASEARAYWQTSIAGVAQEERLLFVAHHDNELVGSAQLALETRRNGDHRAEVQKLMVHTAFRRRGIGRQLMLAVEEAARSAGRSLLVLDTRRGDASEMLYQSLGYIMAGVIPQYARSANGELDDTVFFYKLLPQSDLPWV
jgi:ribosomal protein S18 acetylase RimI-like enzyme